MLQNRYFWASVAIVVMWLAVLFVGVYGPTMSAGGSSGVQGLPVALIIVAIAAIVGTSIVGSRGFRK